jgi:hypothetical protein
VASQDTLFRARFELPELIEQGRTNALQCRVYSATTGSLSAPTSGTVSVYDATNAAIVSAAAVTVTGSIATYSLLSTLLASPSLGDGWRVEWALLMADGVVHTFRNDGALVRRLLYPSWQEGDLYRVCSPIDPSRADCIHTESAFSDKIDGAFYEMERWLISRGNRPNLIINPSAIYDWGLLLTLALIFEDFATRLNAAYADTAKMYRERANAARGQIRMVYDETDSGSRTKTATRPGEPTVWLSGRGGLQSWR